MSPPSSVGLPEALERAATGLPTDADAIRPANGDPFQLLELLDPDAAQRVLTWLLENEIDAGEELADAWAEDPERGTARVLAVGLTGLPKPARKALRRIHHRLRSRGIAVPEESRGQTVAKLPPIDDALESALLTSLDPSGARMAVFVERNPSGGARMFELVQDEVKGIVQFDVFAAGRSQVRNFLREFARRDQFPAVEVPIEAARALMQRTEERQPADRPLPRGYVEWRSHVANPPEGARVPGALAREGLPAPDADALGRAESLVRERRLGPWPPAIEVISGIGEKIMELSTSTIIVSPARRSEQAQDLIAEGLADVYADPMGERLADRFDESAFVLWKLGKEEDALACLAAADAFRSRDPGDNPVARAILEVLLGPALSKAAEESPPEEEPSLLVKP